MISDIRAKGGTVDLRHCGKFTLAEDLSDIEDIKHIDLSGIGSLEGEEFRALFFAHQYPPLRNAPLGWYIQSK